MEQSVHRPLSQSVFWLDRRGNTVEDLPVIATDPLLTASKSCVDVDIAHGRPFQ